MRSFIFISVIVFLTACQSNEKETSQAKPAKTEPSHDHSQHNHGNTEARSFGKNTPIPSVQLSIKKDTMGGWNIHIETDNFRFAPENVNTDNVPNEGHAHIYVDGFKMARVYSHWFHLKTLTPGQHDITISLNANDHSQWVNQGQAISTTQTITQQ